MAGATLAGSFIRWFEATIFDLGVWTFLLDYDDEEEDKEAVLRRWRSSSARTLRGEGRAEHKRGLFRSRPVLRIVVDNREWELGHRSSRPTTQAEACGSAPLIPGEGLLPGIAQSGPLGGRRPTCFCRAARRPVTGRERDF